MTKTAGRRSQDQPAAELPEHRSLRAMLPAVYRQGDFADRFLCGFDDVLAPVVEQLDCLDAYLAPATAPLDFLDWMLSWGGVSLPSSVPEAGRRYALWAGTRLQGLRGTRPGLELLAGEVLATQIEITDSGGTRFGSRPDDLPEDDEPPHVHVRVEVPRGMTAHEVRSLVSDWLPAHAHTVIETAGPRGEA
ncbi:phage tail protein [Streptomyces sp. BA2]|uniref:phage tail protein n=1 Tax=Streptomyces sp. BA2 TaxID=436595 RepID=UPI0013259959|nr:phage tail protein [Streptomyces sp. BA2]MWA07839.1 phage tail protein [Streptomyces sp. BA2]